MSGPLRALPPLRTFHHGRCFRLVVLWLAALLLSLLAGCGAPAQPGFDSPWQPADLRELRPADGPDPDYQMVAAYARLTASDLELRVDFLGSPDPYSYDLYVLVDLHEQGSPGARLPFEAEPGLDWDLALGFPARGLPRAFGADGSPAGVRPRIARLSVQDAAMVRISRQTRASDLSIKAADRRAVDLSKAGFRVFVTRPGETGVLSATSALRVDGPPVAGRANLLLAFSDALPAASPAQALRRWDGAHTGPFGQRHGLAVLLRAARSSGVPLTLLDLRQPETLAALEALGGLDRVRQMSRAGLLSLAAAPDSPAELANAYRLPASRLVYGRFEPGARPASGQAAFYQPPQDGQWVRRVLAQDGARWLPLPAGQTDGTAGLDAQGLTLAVRQALLELALSGDPGGLVVLGGSLPESPWGDISVAGPALDYIAGHPWLHALDGDDLLRLPAQEGAPPCPGGLCPPGRQALAGLDEIQPALDGAPPGLFTDLARQSITRLNAPTSDPALAALRAAYIGNAGLLLAAGRWHAQPGPIASCEQDLDWDGLPECVLASDALFLVVGASDGRLALAAGRGRAGPFQLIGPRSQFAVGLGDPSEWRPELGRASDPQEIGGGFLLSSGGRPESSGDGPAYQALVEPGQLLLTNGVTHKRYRLEGQTIRVEILSSAPFETRLPLALLDGRAYQPGFYGRYGSAQAVDSGAAGAWQWRLNGGPAVELNVEGGTLAARHFAESLERLRQPEDPNTAYPPGHYLPFPLALVEIQSGGRLTVTLSITPP